MSTFADHLELSGTLCYSQFLRNGAKFFFTLVPLMPTCIPFHLVSKSFPNRDILPHHNNSNIIIILEYILTDSYYDVNTLNSFRICFNTHLNHITKIWHCHQDILLTFYFLFSKKQWPMA